MVDLRRVNFNFVDVRVEVGIRIRTSTCDSLSPFVGTPTLWQTENVHNGDRLSTLQPALRPRTAED